MHPNRPSTVFAVFISYSRKDRDVVRPLAERLRADGVSLWFDEWEIQVGDSIPAKIEDGLERSLALLFCMSANSFGSDWATLESHTIRFRDPGNYRRQFIPLRLDQTRAPGSLAHLRCVDWTSSNRAQAYAELLAACRQEAVTSQSERPIAPPAASVGAASDREDPILTALLRDLDDSIINVRVAAMQRLGDRRFGSRSTILALIKRLLVEHPYYKRTASTALGRIGLEAIQPLLDTLPDADQNVFFEIEQAVKLVGEDAVPFVVMAARDSSPRVRARAIKLAAVFEGRRVLSTLVESLRDGSPEVRAAAAAGLGKQGHAARDGIPSLIRCLDDRDALVRFHAASALGSMGANEAVPLLLVGINDADPRVRFATVHALGELGQAAEGAVERLIGALRDSDNEVRAAATEALGRIGPAAAAAIPELQRALDDTYWGVHQSVPQTLGAIGVQALAALVEALGHRDYHIRSYSARALGSLGRGAESAVPALLVLLEDRSERVAVVSIEALGEIRAPSPAVAQALSRCMRHTAGDSIRVEAIRAAGKIGEPSNFQDLVSAIQDPDPGIREVAARAIDRGYADEATPYLVELLQDPNEDVRSAARNVLARRSGFDTT